MIKRIFVVLICAVIAGTISLYGNIVESADSAYNNHDYIRAIELYNTIEKNSGVSSELLYNLGLAYTKTGDFGNAMLCFQRAIKIDPSNREARENIRYIESKVQDANHSELHGKKYSVVEDSPTFFQSIKYYITERHLSNTWAIWAVCSFLLFLVCVVLYVFSNNVILRKIGFFVGGPLAGCCIIFLIFSFMAANNAKKISKGVLMSYKIELKSEASTSAKSTGSPLTQGTVLTIIDSTEYNPGRTQWYKVRLNSDYVGWISSEDFTTF